MDGLSSECLLTTSSQHLSKCIQGEDGHVCLTDFGLAKDFSMDGDVQNEDGEARASTICGTQGEIRRALRLYVG